VHSPAKTTATKHKKTATMMALMVRIETCGVLFEIKLNKKKKEDFVPKR
jgi:hypothetical protein